MYYKYIFSYINYIYLGSLLKSLHLSFQCLLIQFQKLKRKGKKENVSGITAYSLFST